MQEKTLLLVEDDAHLRRALERRFAKLPNVRMVVCEDGVQAVRWLLHEKADLIVTDVDMPHLSGMDLLKYLEGDARHHETLVLVMSGHADEVSRARALSHGARLFVSKPFAPSTLVALVQQVLLGENEGRATSDE